MQTVTDCRKRAPLALFRTLAVADVQSGSPFVVARSQRRTDAGVHATAQQDNSLWARVTHFNFRLPSGDK